MSKDPRMSKEDEQNPLKVQNLAPEPSKCPHCGNELPGGIDAEHQRSGHAAQEGGEKPKMKHGAY